VTIREILSAMRRRWYVLFGVFVCIGLVTVMLARDGGTYTTTTVVSFMRPATTTLSPTNGTNDSSVIAFAGAVTQETNNGRPPARYSMEEAPYYGAGVREGVLVELTNSGNQWVSTFSKAEVEIRIVGRSLDWVAERQLEVVTKVLNIADAQQAAVTPDDRIEAAVVPLTMQIDYVSPSRGAQLAALAAMFAVGLILAVWVSVTFDRWAARRRAGSGRIPGPLHRTQEGATP
jgi:hypothetical protein